MLRMRHTVLTARWLGTGVATELRATIDLGIYDIGVIQNAAYGLTDRCAIAIERNTGDDVSVIFRPLDARPLSEAIIDAFHNALIDFAIRARLRQETSSIRDLIFRQAFVEADL